MELCDMNLSDYIQSAIPADPTKSLPQFVKGGGPDSLLQIWTVMSQIASGVEYIHCEHQIHRDIKPGNGYPAKRNVANLLVLYSSKSSLWKLADFGLSTEGSSQNLFTKYSHGTPGYRAPELMSSDGDRAMYNNKVDIWAIGCILYELATGTRAFKTDHAVISYSLLQKEKGVVLDSMFDSDSIKTITKHIIDMIQIDPLDRPSASFLSKEFNQQLQLAHHIVLLRATNSVTLEAKSESRRDGEDQLVLESQKKTPLDLAEKSPAKAYSRKVFR
jgi:serine/threonine protein kinase